MKKSGIFLLLGLIILTLISVQGTPMMRSGRCSCIKLSPGTLKIGSLKSLDKYLPSPFCNRTEVIAVMKNGNQACLDPNSASVQKLIKQWRKKNGQKKRTAKGKKSSKARKAPQHKKVSAASLKKTT